MEMMTRRGEVRLPAYLPVTTFGGEYPLDRIIRPFLGRFADMMMVSFHYARQMEKAASMPCFVDSGGFAMLLEGSELIELEDGRGGIQRTTEEGVEVVDPQGVLELQERVAEWAATLDFPVPPSLDDAKERTRRIERGLANAQWALHSKQRDDLVMFGSVQGWDVDSYVQCAQSLLKMGFKDLAVGGLVPRIFDRRLVVGVISAIRETMGTEGMLHAFGLGEPTLVRQVYAAGATSTDSASYVRAAASGKRWDGGWVPECPSAAERAHAAIDNLRFACAEAGAGSAQKEREAAEEETPAF